ncbi:Sel1 domain-containing protein [Catenovulum agarivorans DS-2]|uniref:Sel1 domain-containing protein n=1 Tax=Catenovulum agarivorans DS-2 TaxID=1328313 RepID=W7QST2_9ALTE|nr:tetratricopeptide repeat protein [Catenovulum agarivorans]EWH08455.1 Sel1 domain-containing protein [Catenovulum agarivorans DS-2]
MLRLINLSLLLLVLASCATTDKTTRSTASPSNLSGAELFSQGYSLYQTWLQDQQDIDSLKQARGKLATLYEIEPNNVRAQFYYYRVMISLALVEKSKNLSEVEQLFEQIDSSLYHELIAPAYLQFLIAQEVQPKSQTSQPEFLQKLEDFLYVAMQQNPYSAMNWKALSETKVKQGDYDLAIAAAAMAQHMEPNLAEFSYQLAEAYNQKAESLGCVYDYADYIEKSAGHLAKASALEPENPGYKQYTAVQYQRLGLLPLSAHLANQVQQVAPSYWSTLLLAENSILTGQAQQTLAFGETMQLEYSNILGLKMQFIGAVMANNGAEMKRLAEELSVIVEPKAQDVFTTLMVDYILATTEDFDHTKAAYPDKKRILAYLDYTTDLREHRMLNEVTDSCSQSDLNYLVALNAVIQQDYSKGLKYLRQALASKAYRQTSFLWAKALAEHPQLKELQLTWQSKLEQANSGNKQAQLDVAKAYLKADVFERNEALALDFARKAAAQDVEEAYVLLADIYLQGMGVEADLTQAKTWLNKAPEHPRAMYLMAERVLDENSANYQQQRVNLITKAAELGYAPAMYTLGKLYYYGEYLAQDLPSSVHWFSQAAEQGHSAAHYYYGMGLFYGEGTAKDEVEGIKHIFAAAHKRHALAQSFLGIYYHFISEQTDYQEAAYWYGQAAVQGVPIALNNLGDLYENGQGVEQNYQRAIDLYEASVQAGGVYGNISLAHVYRRGLGVKIDNKKALDYLFAAVKAQEADAQFELALWYARGIVVRPSAVDALAWMTIAKNNGYELSLSELAEFTTLAKSVDQQQVNLKVASLQDWLAQKS